MKRRRNRSKACDYKSSKRIQYVPPGRLGRLRLVLTLGFVQAVNSLYQEIDQLTQAYEGMQRMAESKIYNLKALETQVVDLTTVVSWLSVSTRTNALN